MGICDTSVVDWDAVAAVGTWVVGIAAIFVAARANAISVQLKTAERERSTLAARTMLIGLRLEVLHYASRLQRLGSRLVDLSAAPGPLEIGSINAAISLMEGVKLSSLDSKLWAMAGVPQDIAEDISFLYAREITTTATFANTQMLISALDERPETVRRLREILSSTGSELSTSAVQVFNTFELISNHLGVSAEH